MADTEGAELSVSHPDQDCKRSREIEVKLTGPAARLREALQAAARAGAVLQPRARLLRAVYYDTAAGDLQKAQVTLRVRREGRRPVMTVKWPPDPASGPFAREEHAARVTSDAPDLDAFPPEIADRLRALTGAAPLVACFTTRIRRRCGHMQTGRASIELALDSGLWRVDGDEARVDELELELAGGDEAALYELASDLARRHDLRLGVLGKAQRGFALAAQYAQSAPSAHAAVRAAPLRLDGAIALDDFIHMTVNACLSHFLANWPAVAEGTGPDGVHQARVGLRRLRAMLGLFARAAPAPEFGAFRAEAKRIASALGPAREWDVFIAMVEDGPLALLPRDGAFEALLAGAARRRALAYEHARAICAAAETTGFALDLRAFAARRGWRGSVTAEGLAVLGEPAQHFAARILKRMHKRSLRRGAGLVRLAPEALHDLRIDLKKIRYAAEFFGPMFERPRARKEYVRAASSLQDRLGVCNDETGAAGLVDALIAETGPEAALAGAFMRGWCSRGLADASQNLKPAWARFRDARTFWD